MSTNHSPTLPCPPERIDEFLSEPGAGAIEAAGGLAAPVGVLGAGGKMGLHVSAMLRRALDLAGRPEVPVYAISRFGSVHSREAFHRFGVQTLSADLLDPESLAALPDLGTVFFLAGIKFGTSDAPRELQRYNEEMPDMGIVLRGLQGKRFVEFEHLFDVTRGPPVMVVTFIAMLELARERLIEITQAEAFAPVYVRLAYEPAAA